MKTKVDVLLTPADLAAVRMDEPGRTACVVFDVLRATSTIVTALHNGAREIVIVNEISEALEIRNASPDVILAGERGGKRIRAALTGSTDFDLGNSPGEFTQDRVLNKTIVMTTSNGTRAIRGCAGAAMILLSSFLNLKATAEVLAKETFERLFLVCAGTGSRASYEDTLAAGSMLHLLDESQFDMSMDACTIASDLRGHAGLDLQQALALTLNGRRLAGDPDLRGDIPYCARQDVMQDAVGVAGNVARKIKNNLNTSIRRTGSISLSST